MRKTIWIGPLLSAVCVSAQAGAVYETTNKDLGNNGKETVTVLRVQDGKLRVENNDPQNQSVMIFKDDAMHAVDIRDKSYTVIDRAAVKQIADQINPALKQMEEQLKNMPPEQRAMVEKMMGKNMPNTQQGAPAEIVKTGKKGNFAGQACTYVEIKRAGALEQELCLAPPASLTGGQEMFAVAKRMSELMQEMLSSINAPWLRQTINNQMESYSKLDGYPVFGRYYVNGKPAIETTLKSMRAENVPAAQFEVPAGFKRRDMMPQP